MYAIVKSDSAKIQLESLTMKTLYSEVSSILSYHVPAEWGSKQVIGRKTLGKTCGGSNNCAGYMVPGIVFRVRPRLDVPATAQI